MTIPSLRSLGLADLDESLDLARPVDVVAHQGPLLLAAVGSDRSLVSHRQRNGDLPRVRLDELLVLVEAVALRGRGGAAFPFAIKLRTCAAGRRRVVVVNAAEGEPASGKDTALTVTSPHSVLDGAVIVARALKADTIHLVVPAERPLVEDSLARATLERRSAGERMNWHFHTASGFVGGQSRAVIELLAGRPNLPVTSWQPEAIDGHRGRPTLISNAETYAQVGAIARLGQDAYADFGRPGSPGTRLLTIIDRDGSGQVHEVANGSRWADILDEDVLEEPILVGGYHGTWAAPGALRELRVDPDDMSGAGLALGAGVVLPAYGRSPLSVTRAITAYLAGESAGRCGPCKFGLPAMSAELDRYAAASGHGPTSAGHLASTVERRGACAHPDGTARLVRSMLAVSIPEAKS